MIFILAIKLYKKRKLKQRKTIVPTEVLMYVCLTLKVLYIGGIHLNFLDIYF